ncbi:unnamed protein product, partial [marine sediment metagenome]
ESGVNTMNPLSKITEGTFEILDKIVIPEFPCRRCGEGYSFSPFSFCDKCINELIEEEE